METNNLTTAERAMLTAAFNNKESAERAYETLESRGYTKDDINVLMSDDTRKKYFKNEEHPTDLGNKAMEGAGKGSAIGGTLGAIAGVIAAIGTSVLIPGLGLVIAGPIAVGLAGAGAGGVAGGLIGAMVGSGIPEDRAKEYETAINSGHIVMGVRPRTDEDAEHIQREWIVSSEEKS